MNIQGDAAHFSAPFAGCFLGRPSGSPRHLGGGHSSTRKPLKWQTFREGGQRVASPRKSKSREPAILQASLAWNRLRSAFPRPARSDARNRFFGLQVDCPANAAQLGNRRIDLPRGRSRVATSRPAVWAATAFKQETAQVEGPRKATSCTKTTRTARIDAVACLWQRGRNSARQRTAGRLAIGGNGRHLMGRPSPNGTNGGGGRRWVLPTVTSRGKRASDVPLAPSPAGDNGGQHPKTDSAHRHHPRFAIAKHAPGKTGLPRCRVTSSQSHQPLGSRTQRSRS